MPRPDPLSRRVGCPEPEVKAVTNAEAAPPAPSRRRRSPEETLAFLGIPLLVLLAIEFLLGMALALFVNLPAKPAIGVLLSSPWLILHVIVGVMILGITGNALRLSVRLRERRTALVTALGLLSAVVAIAAGLSFAFGGQDAGASFAMSVGFVGVLAEAGFLLIRPSISSATGQTRAPPGAYPAESGR